jgi:hypothetical protein
MKKLQEILKNKKETDKRNVTKPSKNPTAPTILGKKPSEKEDKKSVQTLSSQDDLIKNIMKKVKEEVVK